MGVIREQDCLTGDLAGYRLQVRCEWQRRQTWEKSFQQMGHELEDENERPLTRK